MTKIINLFGGPGSGKSTTAAGVFHRMKKQSKRVELVTEYAKEKVYENHMEVLSDQLYLLAKQNRRLERLLGKVDYIITDSPLLLCAYYGKNYGRHPELLIPLSKQLFDKYNNINFFIKRTKPYIKLGRLGSYEDALKADTAIKELIKTSYEVLDDEEIIDTIIRYAV